MLVNGCSLYPTVLLHRRNKTVAVSNQKFGPLDIKHRPTQFNNGFNWCCIIFFSGMTNSKSTSLFQRCYKFPGTFPVPCTTRSGCIQVLLLGAWEDVLHLKPFVLLLEPLWTTFAVQQHSVLLARNALATLIPVEIMFIHESSLMESIIIIISDNYIENVRIIACY